MNKKFKLKLIWSKEIFLCVVKKPNFYGWGFIQENVSSKINKLIIDKVLNFVKKYESCEKAKLEMRKL